VSSAGISLLAVLAGCSSEATRLDQAFTDNLVTNSVQSPNQAAIIHGRAPATGGQPLQTFQAPAPSALPLPGQTNTVRASDLPPVTETRPLQAAAVQPPVVLAPQPQRISPLRVVDPTTTASTVRPSSGPGGWSAAGGSRVMLKQGETLANLARRFGVPLKALVAVNRLPSANAALPGQSVIIPTYSQGSSAPVASAATTNAPTQAASVALATGPVTVPKPRQSVASVAPTQQAVGTPAFHTVTAGQTLFIVSKKYNVRIAALREANGLTSDTLSIGQRLVIPGGSGKVATRAIDPQTTASVPSTSEKPTTVATKPTGQQMAKVANAAPAAKPSGSFRWPATGRVLTGFGAKTPTGINDGIDIALAPGSDVRAARAGTVIYSGSELEDFGNLVLLSHPGGYVTAYAHASNVLVKRGETISSGQLIAKSGASGNAAQPKLHFEIRKNSTPVNPLIYLPN
jgi:murein DD-endopeptidase MepM/ murein hydrolase activator NlpD